MKHCCCFAEHGWGALQWLSVFYGLFICVFSAGWDSRMRQQWGQFLPVCLSKNCCSKTWIRFANSGRESLMVNIKIHRLKSSSVDSLAYKSNWHDTNAHSTIWHSILVCLEENQQILLNILLKFLTRACWCLSIVEFLRKQPIRPLRLSVRGSNTGAVLS